jgi:ubiquinone/menaquinone biosynthesis C-methylase UbiE
MGCGSGEGTAFLAQRPGVRLSGVDLSLQALKSARQEYRQALTALAQMDVENLAFSNQSFDAIISIEVIEHVSNPISYLKEANRVLKDDGLFMLTTPNQLRSSPNRESLWPEHLREYAPNRLFELLGNVFARVELWGEYIPIYERHPIRNLFRKLAPILKPRLPRWIRIRALHILQTAIKTNLEMEDVVFTKENIDDLPTIIALCRK